MRIEAISRLEGGSCFLDIYVSKKQSFSGAIAASQFADVIAHPKAKNDFMTVHLLSTRNGKVLTQTKKR